jgi:hypothetical protein
MLEVVATFHGARYVGVPGLERSVKLLGQGGLVDA